MKRLLSCLSLLMLCVLGLNAQTTLYSWESPDGTVVESGGTIAYVNGDGDRLNYKNGDYYTICLNGKKANIDDAEPSANAGKMVITLSQPLASGDEIAMTAYVNKNESKQASAYILFDSGASIDGDDYGDESNIGLGGQPTTQVTVVPEAAAGSQTITLTRSKTGTNLFITKLVITRASAPVTGSVDVVVPETITDGTSFFTTFSSPHALDFSGVQGIKAYVGKKNILYDYSGIDACEMVLTPIEKVPANTGLLIKADAPQTYSVPQLNENLYIEVDNDLLVAAGQTDLFNLVDGYHTSVGTLEMRHLQYFDYSTWSMVETDALGFFTVDVPAEPETSFLMPGDVYIALDADEISQMGYYNDYAKLTFTDKALPTADNIAALKGMGDGDATLKLDAPALVTFANDKFLAIEDNTGGLFVENPGLTVQPGDQLSGELSGSYNGSVLYPLMQKSAQTDVASITVTPGEAAPLGKAVASLEEAFDNQMVLVRLTGVKAVVVHGSYGDEYKFELDGTEVDVFPGLDASDEQLAALSDGDELEEVTGYAFVIPETSMYASFYALYQFLPVSIKVKEQAPQEFDYDQISISPAQGQVTSLENFDITFGGQAVTINEDANIALTNAATGDVVADGGMELDEDGTLHVGLADRISAYGRYTLNIPTGAIFFNGTSLDPLSFNYTIKDPSAPAYTIDPAPGTVESLSTFTITFNDYLVDVNDEEALAIIFNTETEAEVQSDFIGAIAGGQKVYISFPEVTTPGEYELIVFDSSIQRTADGKFLPELSFSYTVEAPVVKLPAYKVYEVADGQTVRTTEGEAEMGASVKVPYRHYNVVDGKLYQKGTTGKEYNYTFTLNADGQEETLTYTATGTQDIVFLAEAEDIEGLTPCTSGNSAVRSSNSAAAYAAEADVEVVRLPAGTYKLTAAIFDSSKNPNSMWYFLAGNDTIARLNCTAVNYQERTSEKFTLESETTISLAKGGNGNMGIDLIYIQAVEAETPIFAYTVNEVAAGQTVRTTSGTAEKASVVKVPFRQYNVVEGILYKKAQVGKEFNYTFTLNADQQTENLEYDATDVENVVFLAEGEDIEGLTPITTGNSAIRSSNSAAAYAAEADVEFVTLPAGTYKLVAVLYDSSKEPDSHFIFKAGETVVADLNCTVVNIQEVSSDEFTLNTQSALTIAQGGSVSCGIDLIYIVKTADAVDGIATVSASTAQAPVYDLQGRKVARTAKAGIYIQRSAEGRLQGKNVKKMVVR